MFIIVRSARKRSINIHIMLAFMIPPMNSDIMVTTFRIFMICLFLVINFRELSP